MFLYVIGKTLSTSAFSNNVEEKSMQCLGKLVLIKYIY